MISLGKDSTIKVAYVSCLSTVALQNRLMMASLYCRMAAALAGVGARIVILEGAC